MADGFDLIETPENVELQRQLAGIGSRLIAGVIDVLCLLAVYLMLFLAAMIAALLLNFSFGEAEEAFYLVIGIAIVAVFVVSWGYFVLLEMWTNGQSFGKRAMSLRVVKADGAGIGFLDSVIRNFIRAADGQSLYLVGGIAMFFSRRSQRLGDLAAGTVVISEAEINYGASSGRRVPARWLYDVTPEALRVTGLSPVEYRALWSYWLRRGELDLAAREQLLGELIHPILIRAGQMARDESLVAAEDHIELLLRKGLSAELDGARAAKTRTQPQRRTAAGGFARPRAVQGPEAKPPAPDTAATADGSPAAAEPAATAPPPPPPAAPAAPAQAPSDETAEALAAMANPNLNGLAPQERSKVWDYWVRRRSLSTEQRLAMLRDEIGPILKARGLVRANATSGEIGAYLERAAAATRPMEAGP